MKYLIYSYRHQLFYGPDCAGYTRNVADAGRYERHELGAIITGALPGQLVPISETLVERHGCDDIEKAISTWLRW